MPSTKKKQVEVARARIIDSINTLHAENVQPSAIVEPTAAASASVSTPACAVHDVLADELRQARKEAREAAWVAAELEKEV